jgi:hypothetical protein
VVRGSSFAKASNRKDRRLLLGSGRESKEVPQTSKAEVCATLLKVTVWRLPEKRLRAPRRKFTFLHRRTRGQEGADRGYQLYPLNFTLYPSLSRVPS